MLAQPCGRLATAKSRGIIHDQERTGVVLNFLVYTPALPLRIGPADAAMSNDVPHFSTIRQTFSAAICCVENFTLIAVEMCESP